ncbi:hypothetical protein J3Q64DRAFT_1644350 [Phycomyces blakesleeanus]|uniref:Phosphodiesterase n=1 Tax=Phycomyces blakesleeanus TaxID=4837 RepID=A0ABR3ARS3_PHYBL
MLILRHNTLPSDELFVIECKMLKVADASQPLDGLIDLVLLDMPRTEIYGYMLGLFERLDLCKAIGITSSELLDFLIDVDRGYLPNAYHSFYHAADVTIVLFAMLSDYDAKQYLTSVDMASLLIAALCHDIGHPGKNNNFQVNIQTDLAKRHNNKSVLECYSCTLTMDLLTKHQLLQHIEEASANTGTPTTEAEARISIIKMILATDMIFHYELQENLAGLLEIISDRECTETEKEEGANRECGHGTAGHCKGPQTWDKPRIKDIFYNRNFTNPLLYFESKLHKSISGPIGGSEHPSTPGTITESPATIHGSTNHTGSVNLLQTPDSANDGNCLSPCKLLSKLEREVLCQIMLHAADISNALRPWSICKTWSNLVCVEFFGQGDAEKAFGLPISPNMDRGQTTQATISLKFGDYIVNPYFEIFAAVFPKSDRLLQLLAENRKEWARLESNESAANAGHTAEEGGIEGHLPPKILPDHPILDPAGRRVSTSAGMIVIPSPDEMERRTVGFGKAQRTYWGVRSASHSEVPRQNGPHSYILEEKKRRKSEEPALYLRKLQLNASGRRVSPAEATERKAKRHNSTVPSSASSRQDNKPL